MGKELQTITDAEDGQTYGEHVRVRDGRVVVVHRTGSAGEDEPNGVMRLDFNNRSCAREDYRKDVLFSYAAGDELCVLAAEVQDDDRGSIHVLVFQDLVP